jgi:hypothetical protein
MSENSLRKIPYWDEKAENFGHDVVGKTEVCTGHLILGDVFNPVLMENCPTHLEFVVLVIRPENHEMIDSYRANEKLCAIIALRQGKSHRMALLSKTKSGNCPNRLLSEFMNKAEFMWDWINSSQKEQRIFNKVISGMDSDEVEKTDHELCGLMIICEKHEACIRSKILDEPKLNSPKFDLLCNILVSGIKRLTRNRIKGRGHEKEDNLCSFNNVGSCSVELGEIAKNFRNIVPVVGV